jgi:hypothetical protein
MPINPLTRIYVTAYVSIHGYHYDCISNTSVIGYGIAYAGGAMENIRGDESRCLWCGEALEPEWQGCVVIDEDERCYAEHPEAYYDPQMRVVPRAYGHTACLIESIQGYRLYQVRETGEEEPLTP